MTSLEALLPHTLQDRVEISFLIQYFGGSGRSARHTRSVAGLVDDLRSCSTRLNVSYEILINDDSVHVRGGDVRHLIPALGPHGFLLLSPDLGETRGYNYMASMSRGHYLMMLQDDYTISGGCDWLRDSLHVFRSQRLRRSSGGRDSPKDAAASPAPSLGMLGFAEGICCIQCVEPTLLREITGPRCVEPHSRLPVEAVRCAAMGPLMLERRFFVSMGGFNETLSLQGHPSTLLDCELSGRVWLAGRAVAIMQPFIGNSAELPHVAWKHPETERGDARRCAFIEPTFFRHGAALAAAVRLTNERSFDCSAAPASPYQRRAVCPLPTSCNGVEGCAGCDDAALRGAPSLARILGTLGGTRDSTLSRKVAFIMQYWAGGVDNSSRPVMAATALQRLSSAARRARVKAEFLLNDDSRHIRDGDTGALREAMGAECFVLLSPDVHELRGYNRLAWMSRAEHLVFVQDDDAPPLPTVSVAWLEAPLRLLAARAQVGSISLKGGLFFVSAYDEAKVGVQRIDDLPANMPRCRDSRTNTIVEAARCADVGPLFVRREPFLRIGGFNESGVPRGEPGSVRVDCELQARMWLEGAGAVALGLPQEERYLLSTGHHHVAWDHPQMWEGHEWRMHDYYSRFERPGLPSRAAIEKAARALNSLFDCPTEKIRAHPASQFDCCVVDAPGTCLVR